MLRPPLESAQYTSQDFAKVARANGVVLSVGRKGKYWDNAVADSFSPTSSESQSTRGRGRPGPGSNTPSSIKSRADTTRADCTRPLDNLSPAQYEGGHRNADRQAAYSTQATCPSSGSSPDVQIGFTLDPRFERKSTVRPDVCGEPAAVTRLHNIDACHLGKVGRGAIGISGTPEENWHGGPRALRPARRQTWASKQLSPWYSDSSVESGRVPLALSTRLM